MNNLVKNIAVAAGLGIGLAACGNGGGVVLTPPPPNGPKAPYTQIERLSRPAVKEVFETFNQHKISNGIEPYNDPTIQGAIMSTTDALRPPNMTAGSDYGKALQGVLYPDEYTVNLDGTTGGYLGVETGGKLGGNFGGRLINDDVINTSLAAVFGHALPTLGLQPEDNEENNCLSMENITPTTSGTTPMSGFPYFQGPH